MIRKEKDLSLFKRFVMPILSLVGCTFMIIAAYFSHKMAVVAYLIVFAVIMLIGTMFTRKYKLQYYDNF
jgi:basic amino acid/polyamine antiporter, APA family